MRTNCRYLVASAAVTTWLLLSAKSAIIADITPSGDLSATYNGTDDPWNVGDELLVGNTADGSLEITDGSTVNNARAILGERSSATGSILVSGEGSSWNSSSYIDIGNFGNGILNVESGGRVTNTSTSIADFRGSTGTVTVTGIGSRLESLGSVYAGNWGYGTLDVSDGGVVSGFGGSIGHDRESTGVATITGAGSAWNIMEHNNTVLQSEMYIAFDGNGTLNVLDGGVVNVEGDTIVGYTNAATGVINFENSTLNTQGFRAAVADLRGTGTINARGLVSDVDLVFDATHGLQQQFHLQKFPDQNITLNLDMTPIDRKLELGVGKRGSASLRIADGVVMHNSNGRLGDHSGSSGTAIVTGAGTQWQIGGIEVGLHGNGLLRIERGGEINSGGGTIGRFEGSSSIVFVTGSGSSWANDGSLVVGGGGGGRLDILDNGIVEVNERTWVGAQPTGEGMIYLDGGTLNTNTLLASPSQLLGTGTINTRGLVSDLDLVFDSTNGLNQQIILDSLPNQNVAINIIGEGFSTGSEYFGAGYRGEGTLTIAEGRNIRSHFNYLGYHEGSTGSATVSGEDSTWRASILRVGNVGEGSLLIENGGKVLSSRGIVSIADGSNDSVTVTGMGSTWEVTYELNLGKHPLLLIGQTYSTQAELHIANGGLVRVGSNSSHLGLYVEEDSYINMETGGMLALSGEADGSLSEFMELIDGPGVINYWDGKDWSDIGNAIPAEDYSLEYFETGVLSGFTLLTVGTVPAFQGDYDEDQDVDGADFLQWQRESSTGESLDEWSSNYGFSLAADFDKNGNIDSRDLLDWQAAYGSKLSGRDFLTWQRHLDLDSPSSFSLSVPEPTCGVLMAGIVICWHCVVAHSTIRPVGLTARR